LHSHNPLLPSFLRPNSLDLTMEGDAQTLLALHCLKGTNNTTKSNHVSSSFLISYVLFQLAVISLNHWSFLAPLFPNPITDLDKFVNRLRIQYRTLQLEFRVTDVSVQDYWYRVFIVATFQIKSSFDHFSHVYYISILMEKNGTGAQTWGRCHS